MVLEAGRGPGGRCATRRRRDDDSWRLDHGSPTLSFTQAPEGELAALLASLQRRDVIRPDDAPVVGVDHCGQQVPPPDHLLLNGPRWRGTPTMASVAEALLAQGGESVETLFGERITTLRHDGSVWHLSSDHQARALVLSGTLLAHPRSLAMLGWQHVPLREAVPVGVDPQLDAALQQIAGLDASVRWNLMLELPEGLQPPSATSDLVDGSGAGAVWCGTSRSASSTGPASGLGGSRTRRWRCDHA